MDFTEFKDKLKLNNEHSMLMANMNQIILPTQ